jgi:hypothetical protein
MIEREEALHCMKMTDEIIYIDKTEKMMSKPRLMEKSIKKESLLSSIGSLFSSK